MHVFEFLAQEDVAKFHLALNEALETREPIRNIIHRTRAKNGALKTLESSFAPVFSNGELTGFRGISRDIIGELIFQRAAREALANYRAALASAPTGVVIIQGDHVVYKKPKMIEIAGYSLNESGKFDFCQIIHPDNRQEFYDRYRSRLSGQSVPAEYELRIIRRSGELRYLEVRETIITYNGDLAVLCNAVDISQRKKLEDGIRAIMRSISAASGEAFFNSLILELSSVLGMRFALVCELMPSKDRCKTIAFADNGVIIDNIEYALTDTPCENVMSKGLCVYPRDVVELFPKDSVLQDANACSYIGIPLFATSGEPLGLISLIHDQPIPESELSKYLLTIFAARAGAELERLEAERERADSEERMRQIFEYAHDTIALTDVTPEGEFRIAVFNPAGERVTGLKSSEMKGKSPEEFLPPETAVVVRRYYQLCVERGEPVHFLSYIPLPTGRQVYHSVYVPIRNAEGRIYRILSIGRELTEQIKIKEALRESEERYRNLVERINDWVWEVDENIIFIYSNPRSRDLLGYEPDELLGKTPHLT